MHQAIEVVLKFLRKTGERKPVAEQKLWRSKRLQQKSHSFFKTPYYIEIQKSKSQASAAAAGIWLLFFWILTINFFKPSCSQSAINFFNPPYLFLH
jgi:hypothetical protein